MQLIKIDNVNDLYPENVDQIFKEAFDKYLKEGRYMSFYYEVSSKKKFYHVPGSMVFDKKWANLDRVCRIIAHLAKKGDMGFKWRKKDNHKILIRSSNKVNKHLPCELCKHLDGKIITFQEMVCDQPLSRIDCCNNYGRCLGWYDLLTKSGEVIREDFMGKTTYNV